MSFILRKLEREVFSILRFLAIEVIKIPQEGIPQCNVSLSYLKSIVSEDSIILDSEDSLYNNMEEALLYDLNQKYFKGLDSKTYTDLTSKIFKRFKEPTPTPLLDLDEDFLNKEDSLEIVSTRTTFVEDLKTKDLRGLEIYDHRYVINAGLVLPADTGIHIICGSKDVIHS